MSIYAIYFSPTKNTEKIVKIIASEIGEYKEIDLSKRNCNFELSFNEEDICIIGVPSYGGRVPAIALQRIKHFKANNTKTILVVSYGNRTYEDTIKELADNVSQSGFCCLGAISAVAKHSIMPQFATTRPDNTDKKRLIQFTKQILNKMKTNSTYEKLKLPGNYPYREYHGIPLKPKTTKNCTNCKLCAKTCPVNAISMEDATITNKKLCISCMRCIKQCPSNGRKLNSFLLKIASKKLKKVCMDRKENELFI